MATARPAIGLAHVTVVPTNFVPPSDGETGLRPSSEAIGDGVSPRPPSDDPGADPS